jgi:hypothetical protein
MRQRAADALSKIGGDAALAALWDEFKHRRFQRIGYISSALALFTPESSPGCARRPRATTEQAILGRRRARLATIAPSPHSSG